MKTALQFLMCFLLPVWMLPAVAQIQQPQLGIMLDSDGGLRPIFGVAASASLGNASLYGVNSFACSSTLCLATTNSAVLSFAPGTPAIFTTTACTCPRPALISLDRQGGAWIYFAGVGQLVRWQNGALVPTDFATNGQLLALRATEDGFDYAILRDSFTGTTPSGQKLLREPAMRTRNLVRIEHYSAGDGTVTTLDSLNTTGPVMLLADGILFSSGDRVILLRPNGQQLSFPVAGANTFQAAANGYVEMAASQGMWLLRTDPGKEQLALLPGTSKFVTRGLR